MSVKRNVTVPEGNPDMIGLGDIVVGSDCSALSHEALRGKWRRNTAASCCPASIHSAWSSRSSCRPFCQRHLQREGRAYGSVVTLLCRDRGYKSRLTDRV